MSLANSKNAIGAVTRVLKTHLVNRTGEQVSIGKPEDASGNTTSAQSNLFLYEIEFDGGMKNLPLNEGDPPPIWLVLKYAVTCFDVAGKSDTAASHDLLGLVVLALQEIAYIPLNGLLPANVQLALEKNPEPLKLSFDQANADLLSKLMQGSDEKYRLSCLFQVRPVMIVPEKPPPLSLLVGIDYTLPPQPEISAEEAIQLNVLPSLGPQLEAVTPVSADASATLIISGTAFGSDTLAVSLGGESLTLASKGLTQLECTFPTAISDGSTLSPGSHPLQASETLPDGKQRKSNLLEVRLLPTISSVSKSGISVSGGIVTGKVKLAGTLLGRKSDDAILAFYRDGKIAKSFDALTDKPDQTERELTLAAGDAMPAGVYRVLYRVNGQQARQGPEIDIT